MIIVFINERPQAALCWIADLSYNFEGVLRMHQLISFMTYAELYCRFILEPCSALVSCISLLSQGSEMPPSSSPPPPSRLQAVLRGIKYQGVYANQMVFFRGEGICSSARINIQENK